MKLVVDMPWERDLTHNHMRFGAGGGYRKKPHVQAWMSRLSGEVYVARMTEVDGIFSAGDKTPVIVAVDFRWPDKRLRDTHNYFKVICDAVAVGLGIDDKDILIEARSWAVARENPGFRIEITDEGEDHG